MTRKSFRLGWVAGVVWKRAADPVTTDTAAVLSYQKGDRQATINLAYTGGVTAVGIQYTP